MFDESLVLRVSPAEGEQTSALSLTYAEEVARALRNALMCHAVDPPPAALSGHQSDGRPLERPHAAFLALPDLRANTSSSRIAGVAIVLPRAIDPEERQAILLAAARWERGGLRLVLGRLGALQLSRVDEPTADPLARHFLDPHRWSGPSRRWATVTPLALHHNPGDLTAQSPAQAARAARRAAEIVARGCAHIGLPPPTQVRVMRRSTFPGIPTAPEFMPFPRKPSRPGSNKFQRVCVHAELEFAEKVEGPVLLGAGRYWGVGLCGVRDG